MSADPATVGARVLAGLERGRQRAIATQRARADHLAELVQRAERLDRAAGLPERGRAGRVARRLRRACIEVSDRHIRRILDSLSSVSDSL